MQRQRRNFNRRLRQPLNRNPVSLLGNHLRRLQLTTQPSWAISKNARNDFPPTLVNDVSYSRKVRFTSFTGVTSLNITTTSINAQVFPTIVPFQSICVTAIEAWGPTSSEVKITPAFNTVQGGAITTKDFTDVGAFGSRPSHVRITLSRKDAVFLSTATSVPVATVSLTGSSLPAAGDTSFTVDVTCLFSGSSDVELSDRSKGMMDPTPSLQRSVDDLSDYVPISSVCRCQFEESGPSLNYLQGAEPSAPLK